MEIVFSPIEKITILEEIKFENPQELFKELLLGTPPGSTTVVIWAEGVVFRHSALPLNTPSVAQERIKNKVYWNSVRYAEMPEYKESEAVEGKTVKICKTRTFALIEVAKELKKRLKEDSYGRN